MKPQEILALEKELNTTFVEVDIDEMTRDKSEKTAEYSQNQEGSIIGLSIIHFDLEQIPQIISNLVKLIHLSFNINKITDISPIKELKKLKWIYFAYNKITDISAIQELMDLEGIHFSSNQITDISPIKKLVNLKWLSFYNTKITDISPIKELKKLKEFRFYSSNTTDISPIKELKKNEWDNFHNKIMKPKEILTLEKELKTVFVKVDIQEFTVYKYEKTAQYSQDQEGNVIGLQILS
jgi:Leucine-rich repeat (LRR) protein